MNSNLDALLKNLSDNDFKDLLQKFSDEVSKLVKKKECIHVKIWTVLKSFLMINYLIDANFLVL